jgi:signal transduction histidine kinase/ActR/RegA family two-component response regulator
MSHDWRFSNSPHVAEGGLRAYAGVPLRFQTEFDQHIALGSLCVASNSPQAELSADQQRSLARLADWIVADIITSAKARRQQQQQRMNEMIAQMQKLCDNGANMEDAILCMLRETYPDATVGISRTTTGYIQLESGIKFDPSELDNGLWEDGEHLDLLVTEFNHRDLVVPRVVRVIGAQCTTQETPTFLLVCSKDFSYIFDDVDSGFVNTCAAILSRYWQGLALAEALNAKETFLRGITHQLRTPIHGILGSVDLLAEDLKSRNLMSNTGTTPSNITPVHGQLDPHVYIETIQTSARELISTVNSLIRLNQWASIAQAEREASLQDIAHIESVLLNEVLLALPLEVSSRPSIIFQRNFPKFCDSLTIDLRLFLDCAQPLIVNAAQSTIGGVVAVSLSVAEDYQSFTVDVEDNGRGIDPKDQTRIFAAYEKVDAHTVGAGLGLSLSCKSAALQNGEVSLVWSEVGKGSHFRAVFSDPSCSSSLRVQIPVDQRLVHLPPIYHCLSSPSRVSLLGQQFGRYLQKRSYTESSTSVGALILLDFTPDLRHLSDKMRSIAASQVAICLVPENACGFIDFGKSRFYTKNNILFVLGPFLPGLLEESLARADATLADFDATTLNSGNCAFGGVAVRNAGATTTERDLYGHASSLPTKLATELSQSIRSLEIDSTMPSKALQLSSSPRKPIVLLVDDNRINLRLLEMYCTRRSIPYRSARNGTEAVRVFKNHRMPINEPLLHQPVVIQPFDLVFMDLQMPICDGLDATRQIRALEQEHGWNKSVILIVTGQDSPADRSNANEVGANAYIVKPIGPKDLDIWVKQCFFDLSE